MPDGEGKFGKWKHTWELEYKGRQRGDHSGIKVRRIQGNPLNSFLLSESILEGFSG